ncbi:DUF222 domain-containing protein, partial [Microbispora sp. CSR-4]|uniref:DUF222 domain-containing protein n=1 Tax=Microbispora sp. CSR-4 TaxID=2592813 RepID=UPI0011C8BFE5
PGKGGGVEGEFYLPREAGARLMALLQAYAKLRAQGDDRPLTVRQADALIALLEQKIVTELLVVVSAESLPTDPDNTDPTDDNPHPADPADDVSHYLADLGDSAPSDYAPDPAGSSEAPSEAVATGDCDSDAGSADDPTGAEGATSGVMGDPGAAGGTDCPDADNTGAPAPAEADEFDTAEAEAGAGTGSDAGERRPGECELRDTASIASAEGGETVSTSSAERHETAPATGGDGDRAAVQSGAPHATRAGSACLAAGGGHSHTAPSDTASSGAAAWDAPPSEAAPSEAARPDPPPEDAYARHTHAGPGPAGDYRHGQDIPGTLGTALGASAGGPPGVLSLGASLGMAPGTAPGLLLATGQVLPVSSVHRLARTSTLVRIVMNADGQVLDMGRKVRLATPAQRRAVFARYATCWVDGCPLPATMC